MPKENNPIYDLLAFANDCAHQEGTFTEDRDIATKPQNLTCVEYAVLRLILVEAAATKKLYKCLKTQDQIAKHLGMSNPTVRNSLRKLIKLQYIIMDKLTYKGRSKNAYRPTSFCWSKSFLSKKEKETRDRVVKKRIPELFNPQTLKTFDEAIKYVCGKLNLDSHKDFRSYPEKYRGIFKTFYEFAKNEENLAMADNLLAGDSQLAPDNTLAGDNLLSHQTDDEIYEYYQNMAEENDGSANLLTPEEEELAFSGDSQLAGDNLLSPKEATDNLLSVAGDNQLTPLDNIQPDKNQEPTENNHAVDNTYISTKNGLDNTNIDSERDIVIKTNILRSKKYKLKENINIERMNRTVMSCREIFDEVFEPGQESIEVNTGDGKETLFLFVSRIHQDFVLDFRETSKSLQVFFEAEDNNLEESEELGF